MPDALKAKDKVVYLNQQKMKLKNDLESVDALLQCVAPKYDDPPGELSTIGWVTRSFHKREMYPLLREAESRARCRVSQYDLAQYMSPFLARMVACESNREYRYWLQQKIRIRQEIDGLRNEDPNEARKIREADDMFRRNAPKVIHF